MCSYNQVNGVPNCANYTLLTQTARGQWKFNGYITSDCDAVADIYEAQNYSKTPEEAVAYVLKAGMDVNCGNYVQKFARNATQQGILTEADIDRALQNLFSVRMRLGLFNGNPTRHQPYSSIRSDQVCSRDHQNLALQAALDGIVLLKNSKSLLPLSKSQVSSLAIIGPNANNFTVLLGDYAGPPCKIVTPLMGLQSYVKDTRYLAGCQDVACNSSSIDEAVHLARSVDYVVLFMGLDQSQETEGHDRIDLVLPGMQVDLITSIAKVAKKPVILVLLCGGPVDVDFVKSDPKIGAVLWAGYPGQAGGTAIAHILFGEHNPGGKLPVTWYPQDFTRVPMNIMQMRADLPNSTYPKDRRYPGRTYRFYKGYTVFPFGYGLSYSNYSHEIVTQSDNPLHTKTTINLNTINIDKNYNLYRIEEIGSEASENSTFPVVVRVNNHGPMDGRHPVLMFIRWPTESNGRPVKQLIHFKNVYLKAGEVVHVKFEFSPCKHLSRATEDGKWVIDKGSHFLMVEEDELEITISD
ncbi:putative beta-D-xylosidase 7 [Carex rostrata]